MRSIAFLSTDNLEYFVVYDESTYPHFRARGVEVEAVPWRADVDWSRFDAVVIRSPWDYQEESARFLEVLARIDAVTRLENDLAIVRWNLDKGYLRDLEVRGVPIVPTLWVDRWPGGEADDTERAVRGWFERLDADEVVVKPRVSANADHTYRLDRLAAAKHQRDLARPFENRPFMVQPFIPSVVAHGELSLFYFDGGFSHAVLKTPATGDFRVQEEHGGRIRAVRPDAAARAVAARALEALDGSTLYARIDLVQPPGDPAAWAVMELELIEPSLYFPYDEGSAERFAEAALSRWRRR
ncbi:MAG: hypothetical protein AAGC60_22985 [Acidobacteriota bacterium]